MLNPRPPKRRLRRRAAGLMLAAALRGACAGQGADDGTFEFFAEEARVLTASRRVQPLRDAPVPVDVVTAEEIKASGATSLFDLMRFRVGIDAIDGRTADGQQGIVSIRGLPVAFPQYLQLYIDGNSILNAFESISWASLPVQLEDIERIEIVRGPNAALYGSGAGFGVINIITKKPKAARSLSATLWGGNRRTLATSAAWEQAGKDSGFRLSHSYLVTNGYPLVSGGDANDATLANRGNFRGWWSPRAGTTIEAFWGGSWVKKGVEYRTDPSLPLAAFGASATSRFPHQFGMVKLLQSTGERSTLEIRASRNEGRWTQNPEALWSASDLRWDYSQNDVEALERVDWGKRFHTTAGASYRRRGTDSAQFFAGKSGLFNEIWRGFVHQSLSPADPVTLVAALSIENSRTSGTQPAYQAALLINPGEDHTLRISHSLASTIPSLYVKNANFRLNPLLLQVGNPDYRSQKIKSYDAGYRGFVLGRNLGLDINLFYMEVVNPALNDFTANTDAIPFVITFAFRNRALLRGAETELRYQFGPGRSVYANYTYERISDELGNPGVTRATPRHKLNLGGMGAIGAGFFASVNAGYKDGYTITTPDSGRVIDASAYWRLDARLGYRPDSRWEIFAGGRNLGRPLHREFPDLLAVPRTVYGGVSANF